MSPAVVNFSRMSTSAGGSATSREAPTPFGSCRSSSSSWAAGSSPLSMPLGRATSRFSTESRYPSTISRSPGSPSIAASSTSRGRRRRGHSSSREQQFGLHPPYHLSVIGLVALWGGDASTGAEWLGRAHSRALELGWFDPANRPWTDDYVEALLELGRIDEAVEVLDTWEAGARRLGRQRILVHVLRCRGQIAAARGDIDEAMRLAGRRGCSSRGGRRSLRPGPCAPRPRRHSQARTAEASCTGCDSRGARRIRAARRGDLDRAMQVGARKHRRPHA